MRYKQLGQTGLFVSEICLGTMTFGGKEGGFWRVVGELEQKDAEAIVARALAAGVNFIDTANIYSFGLSEKLLGQALKNLGTRRQDVVIATKVYGEMGPQPNNRGASRGHIMDSVRDSLERLQTDHIDLYQIHAHDAVTPIDETLRALDDLVSQGLVRYVGVSNWAAWQIMKAIGISERLGLARFESLQAYYTIASRDLERELVPMLQSEQLGLMVWSPLAGGLLSGKFGRHVQQDAAAGSRRAVFDFPPVDMEHAYDCVDAMQRIAQARGVSVAQIALAWLLHQQAVTSVIIGAKRLEQLDDNLADCEVTLSPDELSALDQASALRPEYPGWMFTRQGEMRRTQLAQAR